MQFLISILSALAFLATTITAIPSPSGSAINLIYQFPNLTILENIAVRPSGSLLLTDIGSGSVYHLDPSNPTKHTTVVNFAPFSSAIGITEISPDVFVVVAGNFSFDGSVKPAFSLFKIDFRKFQINSKCEVVNPAVVSKVLDFRSDAFPNGMTLLHPGSPYVLVADSSAGLVWRVNVNDGTYSIILQDALLKPDPKAALPIGLNGIHVFKSTLFFSNSALDGGFIGKVPIDLSTGAATGAFEIFVKNGPNDDFAISKDGVIYTATNSGGELQRITPDGKVQTVAGSPTDVLLEGDTSVAFGKGRGNKAIVYVTTNGGWSGRVPGTYETGGKVVAVDTRRV